MLWRLEKFISEELYKYLVVGGINTVFGYSIFALSLFLGLHYSIAVLLATILGILFNFQTYGRIVFKSHSWQLIGRFVFVYAVLYLISLALLMLFDSFIVDLYLAGAIVMLFVSYLGYVLNKRYVWTKS
jgi:putative flippase GtrA